MPMGQPDAWISAGEWTLTMVTKSWADSTNHVDPLKRDAQEDMSPKKFAMQMKPSNVTLEWEQMHVEPDCRSTIVIWETYEIGSVSSRNIFKPRHSCTCPPTFDLLPLCHLSIRTTLCTTF
ncbi:hypothetical protein [Absidia glauca]|uniref:Uncharacterized protein n=1 Tax=Absidia glauca TaxID=4829 RepID=A0A168R5G1_ABSGL|nr:hypothetical protein [Absidia glauca]